MKINKTEYLSVLTVIGLSLSGAIQASLIDRGGALIYDDVLDVTWLQDANYAKTSGYDDTDGEMSWSEAKTWADQLVYGGYDDWRLPDVKPGDYSFRLDDTYSYDGTTDSGYNINGTQSEMGYMFYQNLGIRALIDTSGVYTSCNVEGSCLTNMGLFYNIGHRAYWFGVEYENSHRGWHFATFSGIQDYSRGLDDEFHAWAVRSGDVAVVPVPATFWLMASGLLGVAGLRKKR